MLKKARSQFSQFLVRKIVKVLGTSFFNAEVVDKLPLSEKMLVMDALPIYEEAAFCNEVSCYISSTMELMRTKITFDSQAQAWLASFKPGEIFYDIGANIGMFSLALGKIHNKQVKSYAFEPSFSTFATLVRNVIVNDLKDVVFPFDIVVGNAHGLRHFNYTDVTSGKALHTVDKVVNQKGREFLPAFSQQVVSYSLDYLVEVLGFESPNHIKIDVDGGEFEIIEGMKEILKGPTIKSVMIEITDTYQDDEGTGKIFEIFMQAGFKEELRIDHGSRAYPILYDVLFIRI